MVKNRTTFHLFAMAFIWLAFLLVPYVTTVHAATSDSWEYMITDSGGNYFVASWWWISTAFAHGINVILTPTGYCICP